MQHSLFVPGLGDPQTRRPDPPGTPGGLADGVPVGVPVGVPTSSAAEASTAAYKSAVFSGIPLVQTRLVEENTFPYGCRIQVKTPSDLHGVLREYFRLKDREEFLVCLLETSNALVGLHVASVGGLAASIVEPRQVFKAAVLANAASIILAHNHPSSNPNPSTEDIEITKRLVEAGRVMGIRVLDHVICAGETFVSLAELGHV